uniref:Uncharacterized protein n=1 Tax=Ditylenchus dipsaci TaxID=166011 RepID=A0A915ER58_9BILA
MLLRCLRALAFLPVNEVTLRFGEVVAALEEKIQDAHLQYFENTDVGRVDEKDFLTDALFPVSGFLSSRLFSIKRREPTMRWRDGIECNSSADPLRGARSAKVENSEPQIFKLVQDYSNADVLLLNQKIAPYCPRVESGRISSIWIVIQPLHQSQAIPLGFKLSLTAIAGIAGSILIQVCRIGEENVQNEAKQKAQSEQGEKSSKSKANSRGLVVHLRSNQ